MKEEDAPALPARPDKLKDYVGKCMPVGTSPQSQTCPDGQRRDERGRCPNCRAGYTDKLKGFEGKCMPIGTRIN
jgi:hypothetical protein